MLISYSATDAKPNEDDDFPSWLSWDEKKKAVLVTKLPERDDIGCEIEEQLIVEYYSR